jgi:ubiquinone/menaquinone biosynthesis C-methylase UbiE
MTVMDEPQRWQDSAEAWDRWADRMAGPADRINRPLLDALGLHPGQVLLDLASGVGEPVLQAADRIGPSGLCIATDLVPAMLTGLQRRAMLSLPAGGLLPCVAADMLALPFADSVFDRISCRFGIMFVPDIAAVGFEIARILRPDGFAVFAVWGDPAANDLFRLIRTGIDSVLPRAPIDPLQVLFRFAEPGALSRQFQAAGMFCTEQVLTQSATTRVDRPFWRATLEMAFAPQVKRLHEGERVAIDQAIQRLAAAKAASQSASGFDEPQLLTLTSQVRLITARRSPPV